MCDVHEEGLVRHLSDAELVERVVEAQDGDFIGHRGTDTHARVDLKHTFQCLVY